MRMRCPICNRPADMTQQNPFRPFCSERCRMVDLGTWASEEYRVAGGKADDKEHPDDITKPKLRH
ncbi:MAG: DNA gyrase inhibitor YacG [Candidatus Binataceae bacterium]